ncbi:MAG: methyltransferase [Terriglobales bacterium]
MAPADGSIGNVVPNTELVRMAMSYARSRVLGAAAGLGVADALGDGEADVEVLAAACAADADALYRLLRALASLGITEETAPHRFRLTAMGRPLRRDAPNSAWPAVTFWADLLADEWRLLTDCVRTGRPASQLRAPGASSRWADLPGADAIFRAVMGAAPASDYAPIAAAWDFSRASVVADLGGGGGALLLAVLERHPHLRGMLVDREVSLEAARPRFAPEPLASRCRLVTADLSQSVPAGADVLMLKQVLHGYRDPEAVGILRNCRAALPEHGRVLVIEFILPPLVSHADPDLELRLMSDINMLAVTGGRERNEQDWSRLLAAADFQLVAVHPVGSEVGIVEGRPVSALGR